MFKRLAADPDFIKAAKQTKAAEQLASSEAAAGPQLRGRVRLLRATYPPPFEALDHCVRVLGLTAPVDLLVENAGIVNAWVETPPGTNRIQITLTNGLLNTCTVDEIAYVLGHELGHALLGHLETRVGGEHALPAIVQLRRLALARYQELSADRVGLLCCPDVDIAMRAEFMIHTGVTGREKVGTAQAIVRAAEQAVDDGEGKATDVGHGYHTHPAGAFRTLATWWFAHSETFTSLNGGPARGAGAATLTEADLEKKVQSLIDLMNPSILDEKVSDADVHELAALAALAVAEAHEGASDDEIAAIRKLSPSVDAALEKARAVPYEERQIRMLDLSEKLGMTLPTARRARLVEDLTIIAEVDGNVAPEEQMVIQGMSIMLGIPPYTMAAVIEDLNLD